MMALKRIASLVHLSSLLTVCVLFLTGCVAMIHTNQQAIGWVGENIRLPCDFSYQNVLALYWMNSSSSSKANFVKQERKSFDDRFSLNEDFSLTITNITVSDEGRYMCRLELDSGRIFISHTKLKVYAAPSMPDIKQCPPKLKGNKRHRFCTVETSNTGLFNLDCRVTGFRPNVTLEWTSLGLVKQSLGEPDQRTLPDGTSEREITISVTAEPSEIQRYTCTVRGEATNGTDWSTTVTVLVTTEFVPVDKGSSVGGKVVLAIFLLLLIICITPFVILGVMVGLRRNKRLPPKGEAVLDRIPFLRTLYLPIVQEEVILQKRKEELSSLRQRLSDYTFERPDGSSVHSAHIGLFGEMSAGKSAFMNSLEFAFTGEFKQSQVVGAMGSAGGKTISRDLLTLTESISLFDNRGMSDFKFDNLEEIQAQLRGERGPDIQPIEASEQEEIHCGVFVVKFTQFNRKAGIEFIAKFERELRQYNGYPPMIVITHAALLKEEEKEDILGELALNGVIENVWFFENYTRENATEDEEKSIEMLKFLDAALKQCKLTVVHTDRRKNTTPVKPKKKEKKRQRDEPPSTSRETAKDMNDDANENKGVRGWVKSWFS